MSARAKPMTPLPLTIGEALDGSAPLARLRASLRESAARFEAIRCAIPSALRPSVRPGPVDDEGWSLFAANPSVAAKLRQLAPRFDALVREAGLGNAAVRIKVMVP
jgi:hypothetical protein